MGKEYTKTDMDKIFEDGVKVGKELKKPTAIKVVKEKMKERDNEISTFINNAIEKSLPVETMEKLFALRKEFKAEKAKEDFVIALSSFQGVCPVIKKTKKVLNKDGRTIRYMYAPMDSVIQQIKKPLCDNGLSYNWDSVREEEHIKVVCKLTNISGHSEKSTFDIPIVQSQFMTSPQSYATAQSYAKRYTLLNVLGIGTADEDTDATDSDNNAEPQSQKSKIILLLRKLGRKTETKEEIEKAIKEITSLPLKEENYDVIIERLELTINEKEGL